jgi:predicted nucleic acid-binding Zn finger protein
MSKLIMPTHALEAGQVWLKSVGKQRHFTLEDETVFCPHLLLVAMGWHKCQP